MNTQQIREIFLNSEKQYILNYSYMDGDDYYVLAMLEWKDDQLCLWEVCSSPEEEELPRRYRKPRTNRQELLGNLKGKGADLGIRKLVIDGHSFSIHSASGLYLGDMCNDAEKIMFLCMLQNGLFLGELEQMPIERLRINCYELQQPEGFRLDDLRNIAKVAVKLDQKFIPVLVNKRFLLKTGAEHLPRKISLKQCDMNVYMNRVEFYDIWEEAKTKFDDARYTERFSTEELAEIKRQYMETLPDICPKGKVLPLIEYETDKDYQVQFYTQEHLRCAPKHSSSTSFMMFTSDKEEGPHGYKCFVCALEPVEKGFAGDIPVELFLYYQRIPEKSVECVKIEVLNDKQ